MFERLATLLASCEKIVLTLALKGEQMTVLVAPTVKGGTETGLAMPLVLTATAAELDAGFIEALASFTASRRSLAEQVEATAAVLAAAKSTQTQKASKALSNAARVQSTAGVSAEDDDEDLEAGGSTVENIDAGTSSATSTAATSATPPAAAGTDLASLL